jgi:DNA-directed RNA polymerase specialized sigma24 family protein
VSHSAFHELVRPRPRFSAAAQNRGGDRCMAGVTALSWSARLAAAGISRLNRSTGRSAAPTRRLSGLGPAFDLQVYTQVMVAERQHPLAGTELSDVFPRLIVYAVALYGGDKVMAGTGKSPEDLAGDVILELLQGKLRYDGRRPLLPLLKKALFHDFLDLKKSAGRRTTVILEAAENEEGELAGGLDGLPAEEASPPDVLFRQTVHEVIGDDQHLKDYTCAFLECGAERPADVASVMGITTDEVENLRKRLRRAIASVRARLET